MVDQTKVQKEHCITFKHTSAALIKKWEDEAIYEHHRKATRKKLTKIEKKLGNLKYLNRLLEHSFQNVSDTQREKI